MNGENINSIRYADDSVQIAQSAEELQRILDNTSVKSKDMGLSLNIKTVCMIATKKTIIPERSFKK